MAVTKKPRTLTDNTEVTVINNTKGKLIYISKRTNDMAEWSEYGDEDTMTIGELRTMKAQQRLFFEEQWVIFAEKDYDVIPYLKLEKYYKEIITPEQIDEIFEKPVPEFVSFLQNSTANVKTLIFTKAKEKYENSELRDIHMIDAIEQTLGVEIDLNKIK